MLASIDNVSEAISEVSTAIQHLGSGNAYTQMGAIGNLANEVKCGTQRVAAAIESLAAAVRGRQP